ncbi:MAG: efflux RND transporter permease subunit, partial [Verrucomicrobiota bacterium]
MINPAEFSLKNNRTTLVIYALVMMVGVITFNTIGRLEYPEFTIRTATVITSYPGRTAAQVEEEVTRALEQSIRELPELDEVTSTSKSGVSIISVELREEFFELEDIWSDLRNLVEETPLPDGANQPQLMDDVGDVYPYVYALVNDGFSFAESYDFAKDIRDSVLEVPGVSKIEIWGQHEERVYLEFSSAELAALGTSPLQITNVLANQNSVASSGQAMLGRERMNLVTRGEFESIQELADYQLSTPGEAGSVRVSDVFDVRRGYQDPFPERTHFNGKPVVCIAIAMQQGEVVSKVGARIEARLAELQAELPHGIDIEQMFFQPEYVDKSVSDFLVNLGQAFFFVVIVMLLFAGWRIATIVGLLVPSAVLMCFAIMPTFEVQLEMMSIAALIIALGLLVDNAVVVSEQILVRLGQGEERQAAVIGAVKNLMIPLLAASATTIAAFSPIALAPGATSEFTFSLFAVVSITLLSSWVLSLTIIPLFCYYFLKPLKRDTIIGRALNLFYKPYEWILRLTLKLRWVYP